MGTAWSVCLACFSIAGVALAACSRSNNLLFGRVEAIVGTHRVVVTDCYRLRVPQPEKLTSPAGSETFRFMPCRDADVLIEGDQLRVNGRHYGRIDPTDSVLVDHGIVSMHRVPTRRGFK